MSTKKSLAMDNDLFSSLLDNETLIIKQKQNIQRLTKDINTLFSLYEDLEYILSSKSYKTMIMFASLEESEHLDYCKFLGKALSKDREDKFIYRLSNAINRLTLVLSTLNGVTVYAGQGNISLLHLNLSLAYDYRIVEEGTVFENFSAGIGLIAKGSGYYLPRLLGVQKATEVLQWKNFSAEEALQLGLVDRIVPAARLEAETMRFVKENLSGSTPTLLGIRKLLKCDAEALQRSLDLEDLLLKESLESKDFRESFNAYCIKSFGMNIEELLNSSI